jgi:hypothetical protein
MTINKPLKVLIGILTLLVFLQPFVYFLSWVLMVFPIFMGNTSSYPCTGYFTHPPEKMANIGLETQA